MKPQVSNTLRAGPAPVGLGRLVIEPMPGQQGRLWKLALPLAVEFYGVRMEIDAGEVTDFATVPGPFAFCVMFSVAALPVWWFFGIVTALVMFFTLSAAATLLLPKRAIYSIASVFHDHLYRSGKTSKWMADALFFSLLRYEPDPVGWCCRSLMWTGVWAFGWFAWWKHRRTK